MKLDIREMIAGGPTRLRYVFRYSTSRVGHPENVAEHSYYVALYCLFISRWVKEQHPISTDSGNPIDPYNYKVDTAHLLQRALLHDLEEARSGDFPRPFKHSSPEVRRVLEGASKQAFIQLIEPLCGPQGEPFVDPTENKLLQEHTVTDEYICSWLNSKDGTAEGRILEFADFLSVLSFLIAEGAGNGNRSIASHVKNMDKYFAGFQQPAYDFIRPLVAQASMLMKEAFP